MKQLANRKQPKPKLARNNKPKLSPRDFNEKFENINDLLQHDITKITNKNRIKSFAWTANQSKIISQFMHPETTMAVLNGVWGSGKTLMGVHSMLRLLDKGVISKILYVRNVVQSGVGQLGFLGGGLDEKMEPYVAPLQDKLYEILDKKEADKLLNSGVAYSLPACLIRGRNFIDTGMIIDEASSFHFEDLLLVLSRLGEGSKVWVCGDTFQCDVRNSGFERLYNIFDTDRAKLRGVHCSELRETQDIMRSDFVRFLMEEVYLDQSNGQIHNGSN